MWVEFSADIKLYEIPNGSMFENTRAQKCAVVKNT